MVMRVFVAGVGTGGTVSGTSKFLKEVNPKLKTIGIDPVGSILTDYHRTGKKVEAHPYLIEGVGEDIIPDNVKFPLIDDFVQVSDQRTDHPPLERGEQVVALGVHPLAAQFGSARGRGGPARLHAWPHPGALLRHPG